MWNFFFLAVKQCGNCGLGFARLIIVFVFRWEFSGCLITCHLCFMRIEDNVMYTSMAFCMNDYFLGYTIEKANYTNKNRIPFNQK